MASTWQRADMGGVSDAATSIRGIRHIFPRVHAAAGYPADMAIFERFDVERRVVVLYFTTTARPIAEIYGAQPCPAPCGLVGLRLVCGAERCWRVLDATRDCGTALLSSDCDPHAASTRPVGDAAQPRHVTQHWHEFVVPRSVDFAELDLAFGADTRSACYNRAPLAALCEANDLDATIVIGNDEWGAWMITQWYRVHRERGGERDPVGEALLAADRRC